MNIKEIELNLSLIRVKITLPVSALHCDSDTFDSPPLLLIPTPKDCQTGTSFHWILVLQLPAFCATSCYYYRKACLKKPQKTNKQKKKTHQHHYLQKMPQEMWIQPRQEHTGEWKVNCMCGILPSHVKVNVLGACGLKMGRDCEEGQYIMYLLNNRR